MVPSLSIKEFTYFLPEEKIAKHPLPVRDESKLLVYKDGLLQEDIYYNLTTHIPSSSLLVFNNTKVIEARLLFEKSTGGSIEIFCLEPAHTDITTAMMQKEKVTWKCLVGGAKKWRSGTLVKMIELNRNDKDKLALKAHKVARADDYFLIEFSWNDDALTFAEILHLTGSVPLPPYLKRAPDENDKLRYQTIYAKFDGSVAAPTAGLHFTERVFKKLHAKNIHCDYVTLHVSAGTFLPVKSETIQQHQMHGEYIHVRKEFIEKLLRHINHKVIAVGTTSLRTIETLYWLGVKTINSNISLHDLQLAQWEAYELNAKDISPTNALDSLMIWMQKNALQQLITKTHLIIVPGYTLKIADALCTNYHQPQSTLLLLVGAIVGDDWKKIYSFALENNFRFLSYGDGSLLWKRQQ